MRPRFAFFFWIFAAFPGFGCSGDAPADTGPSTSQGYCGAATAALLAAAGDPIDPTAPLAEEPVADSTCNAVIRSYPIESSTHFSTCGDVSYGTNPPSSGHHYVLFPEFATYPNAIPRGFWVHSLEHGGVVITYSCRDCADEVASAAELRAGLEIDPLCCNAGSCGDATNRMLLTPDPGLPTRWAASAWGFTLTADCFEPEVFKTFAQEHRGLGTEQICSNEYATDVSKPGPSK
jgi:hypothetical protein